MRDARPGWSSYRAPEPTSPPRRRNPSKCGASQPSSSLSSRHSPCRLSMSRRPRTTLRAPRPHASPPLPSRSRSLMTLHLITPTYVINLQTLPTPMLLSRVICLLHCCCCRCQTTPTLNRHASVPCALDEVSGRKKRRDLPSPSLTHSFLCVCVCVCVYLLSQPGTPSAPWAASK